MGFTVLAILICFILLLVPAIPTVMAQNHTTSTTGMIAQKEVHVALFLKTDRFVSASGTGAVSITAEGGLSLQDNTSTAWMQTTDNSVLRASVDGFRVLVFATSDNNRAATVYKAIRNAGQPAAVYSHSAKDNTVFRIYAGPYSERTQADAVRVALANDATLVSQLNGAPMRTTGTSYVSIGQYNTEAEVMSAALPLWDVGLVVIPVRILRDSGTSNFALWIGEAVDENGIAQVMNQLKSTAPSLVAMPIPQGTKYGLLRTDRAGDNGLTAGVRRVDIGGNGMKLTAVPRSPDNGIKVIERFNRVYRGIIDISPHNATLAVINRVGLESYVASVVGSELDSSWPVEVMKAQAVAARTYVIKQGWKYAIAQVSDTTADQSYRGVEREFPGAISAAQATSGEILMRSDGKVADSFYHSNAGNMTANPMEVWNQDIPGFSATPSPDDIVQRDKLIWYRIVSAERKVGYVRSDLIRLESTDSKTGFPNGIVIQSAANVREAPFVSNETNPAIFQLKVGERVTIIGMDTESTSYEWIRGPISADRLLLFMMSSGVATNEVSRLGSLIDLKVTARGNASGRVTAVTANGTLLSVQRGDQYRTLLGLPSTRFEIEATSSITILGAGGKNQTLQATQSPTAVNAISAGGAKQTIATDAFLIKDGYETTRVATRSPAYRFHGFGFGHGIGLSQWGAYGLSELGYDYKRILGYYYKDTTIVKE
jgi:stage II sporulation protein D